MVVKVYIDDIEYKAETSYNISDTAGAVSNSDITVKVPTGAIVPRALMSCRIEIDSVPQFSGIIYDVTSPSYSTSYESKNYKLTLQSLDSLFNNRLVSESFTKATTEEIITTVFNNYIADEGITLGKISTGGQLYKEYNCSYTQLSQVLSELAEVIGASYYVSADKKFYFLTRDSFESITAPEHISELSLEEETGDIRTVQIVTGASEETSSQTENKYWETGLSTMILGYQVSTITGITINAISAGVGLLGVDEDDATKTFLYQKGSNVLTINSNATVKPAGGQNVVVVYNGYYDIIVTNTNDSLKSEITALNGSSGIIEKILTDTTITTFADADLKATGLLSQYGERDRILSCTCHSLSDTEIYTLWNIDRPDLNISGAFVVTERSISAFGVDAVSIQVKLRNKNYFSKYGKSLTTTTKTRGSDIKVYKTMSIGDKITITDDMEFMMLDLAYYPTDGGSLLDTMLNADSFCAGV